MSWAAFWGRFLPLTCCCHALANAARCCSWVCRSSASSSWAAGGYHVGNTGAGAYPAWPSWPSHSSTHGILRILSPGRRVALPLFAAIQFRIDVKDNLEARKVYTQVKVLKKIAVVVVVLFTAASMLMVFDSVRQLGTSILASAGVLGIIVGFAAQRSIATVLAGFQIAITQPIRLDDVVIVEGEWGRIEEITLTYVVVLIWDQRRLIVPISYFIEKPFQNWTRVSADLLGSVFLYVDYTVPLKALRDKLDQLLDHSKRWDRKVKVIQVTDAKPNGMEVRVLVSAPDASTAWDLRCELREKLIDFLQRNYPQCLPQNAGRVGSCGCNSRSERVMMANDKKGKALATVASMRWNYFWYRFYAFREL